VSEPLPASDPASDPASNPASDVDFYGLRPVEAPGTFGLDVTERLCTPFGFLYGGSGIGSAITAAELVTGRPLVWITVQYLANAFPGEELTITVEVPAAGRGTSQAHVVARVGERLVFQGTTAHNARRSGDSAQFGQPPAVPPPDECEQFLLSIERHRPVSFVNEMDRRVPAGAEAAAPDTGHLPLWVRMPSWPGPSAARLGHVADVVPVALFRSMRRPPGATSLDNTLRMIDPDASEWVLMDIEAHGASRSIGHGQVRMWSDDGRLLAIASQTCILRTSHLDPAIETS
jgi:acyl-CoA thioesterase